MANVDRLQIFMFSEKTTILYIDRSAAAQYVEIEIYLHIYKNS